MDVLNKNGNYRDFLQNKISQKTPTGFDISDDEIHPILFDWQRDIVKWSLKIGKAALFEECGLGKTLQQLEWAKHVANHTRGTVLVLAPLAVAYQTIKEAKKIDLDIRYLRHQDEIESGESIIVTNYDMLKAFDPDYFSGVVLDESSILKAFTGKTKQAILSAFKNTPYKLACTATPAPNDHLELGNHAEFLNIMPSNEMISRWFINNTMQAGDYRLKKHAEDDFWRWVTTWAVCISTPSDLGYDDCGFDLPELKLAEYRVGVDHTRAFENGRLLLDATLSATDMWQEKRATAPDRVAQAIEIIEKNPNEFYVVWCDTNYEADLLKEQLPEAIEVRGSMSPKRKEELLNDFSEQRNSIIITKPDIAGFGLNWQHVRNPIFVGVTYSFEKFYQAIRRNWRYGVEGEVTAHIIYAESEDSIIDTLRAKQEAHKIMQIQMNKAMQKSGLTVERRLELNTKVIEARAGGELWTMYQGDSVQITQTFEENSMDFVIFSPPFSNLYIYTDSIADMGNTKDDSEFFNHFEYLIEGLWKVTRAGRLVAIHCKDLPLYMNRDGAAGLRDFPGEIIRRFEKYGFVYHSRVTIWKDPVIEMQRTKNHGLLHANFVKWSEVCRQGMADFLIVMRKWSEDMNEVGVHVTKNLKADEYDFVGTMAPKHFDSDRDYSIQVWQRYASPVWFDIDQTNVLNFRQAKDQDDEKHICPLQLDVIERAIDLWTNPDEIVFSPFAGIGSEGYSAIKRGRKFVGIELKESYFEVAQKYLIEAEQLSKTKTLFSFAGLEL